MGSVERSISLSHFKAVLCSMQWLPFNPHEGSFPPDFETLQISASSFAFGPMLSGFLWGSGYFVSACHLSRKNLLAFIAAPDISINCKHSRPVASAQVMLAATNRQSVAIC